jgi:hypothetical protein
VPVLSAANVIQAKTDSASNANPVDVVLDNPTTEGSTVTLEMWGPAAWPGMPSQPGWEGAQLWAFRRSDVAAGEGVAGSTPWTVTYFTATNWMWRVTEWDRGLEPVSPFERAASNGVAGATSTLSTTTTSPDTNRAETVCLATHLWFTTGSDPTKHFAWTGHTGGFTERDQLRASFASSEACASWSWRFNSATGVYECTATEDTVTGGGDSNHALLVVYAATTTVDAPAGVLS